MLPLNRKDSLTSSYQYGRVNLQCSLSNIQFLPFIRPFTSSTLNTDILKYFKLYSLKTEYEFSLCFDTVLSPARILHHGAKIHFAEHTQSTEKCVTAPVLCLYQFLS